MATPSLQQSLNALKRCACNTNMHRLSTRTSHISRISAGLTARTPSRRALPSHVRSIHSSRTLLQDGAVQLESSRANSSSKKEPEASAFLEQSTDLSTGLSDQPIVLNEGERQVDWTRSFHGLSTEAFSKEAAEILQQPLQPDDIEVKPDGMIYLPEIKYRRILNKAFGPGGWGLAPRGETIVTGKAVTREYALVVHGRLVSIARGEQDYFSPDGIPTATEGCKSNALMRCCKDIGIASELWDPRFIRKFMAENAKEIWVEHSVTKKRRKIFIRKDDRVQPPYKETK